MVNKRYVVGGSIVLVLILAVGVGAAFYYGVGAAPGGSGSGEELSDFPTATTIQDGSAGSGTDSPSGETLPFSFTIDSVEECGQTCRDVTATLHNNQNETATGVVVYTRVFAGENTTAEDDRVWQGKEEIGTIAAGASHSSTERVELSLQEANMIQQRDGWITIFTTVQTDDRTVTFIDSKQVA